MASGSLSHWLLSFPVTFLVGKIQKAMNFGSGQKPIMRYLDQSFERSKSTRKNANFGGRRMFQFDSASLV